jgi:cysteine-S-conjugate beta-lyase
MKYDFDRVINRKGTASMKWDTVNSLFGEEDILPMWVADMDFPSAQPITDALLKRAEHQVYGYTVPGNTVIDAITERIQRKYNWKIEPEWIVFTPGVIPAIHAAIRAFTHPGDEIIIQSPVYYPFWSALKDSGCQVANNQLKLIDGHYEIDFDDLRSKFTLKDGMTPAASRARMMILCSPHNPVGRVWSREDLVKMGEIVIGNKALMLSDEIHCELLFKGVKHIPFASISSDFEQHTILCMAPSKTFNLAGLNASFVIIPNEELRLRFNAVRHGIVTRVNLFGLTALEAAYRYGDEWLEQLLKYLQGNLDYLINYFEQNIPEIEVIKPEGTYLVWLDCRKLGLDNAGLRKFMRERAKVGLDDGYLFGSAGVGFQRINIACPRSTLAEALERIENAVNSL